MKKVNAIVLDTDDIIAAIKEKFGGKKKRVFFRICAKKIPGGDFRDPPRMRMFLTGAVIK